MNPLSFEIELVTGSLKNYVIPERSQLFALAPVESVPEQREGLISLLVRTSGAHSLNPRRLIAGIFSKAVPAIEALAYPCFFNRLAGTINGHGKYASLFVQALENLTGQHDLTRLTMLPWTDLLPHNGQGMLSRHPRWCSACLLEQRRSREDVYFPLLWSLEGYRHCTTHSQPLDDHCPHCGKQQPFLPRYPDQAICHHCLRSLINMSSTLPDQFPAASEFDTWIEKALGTMVAHQSTLGFAPSLEQFRLTVNALVDAKAGGNRAAFCRSIGFNEHALKNWLTKGERPSITQLLALCYAVQVPPVQIASGNANFHITEYQTLRRTEKLKIRQCNPNNSANGRVKLMRVLRNETRTEEVESVSSIAKRWGVTAQYLRYWFPEVCCQLTARRKTTLRLRSARHLETKVRRVREIVREFRESNRYPSRRKVDSLLRNEGASLGKHALRDAYRKALIG